MIAFRTAALALGAACILAANDAHAQNAAALAKMAARNADAFDTLVTPGARRALDRLTENDEARTEAKPQPSRPAPQQSTSAKKAAAGTTRAPAQQTAPAPAKETIAATPASQADSASTIREIFAQRADDLIELRIVSTGRTVPALSEPFRAGDHTRLFITFEQAKLALSAAPAMTDAGATFAGMDIAERDGRVRIAVDIAELRAYELAMIGDTAVLRVALPANAVAAPDVAPSVAKPDELALVREAARAGWAAFRQDVSAVASGLGGFLAEAGSTIVRFGDAAWDTTSSATVAGAHWLAASVPFASMARALVLLTLLGAPPFFAVRLLRRRQSARAARPAEIVGLEKHTRAGIARVVKQEVVAAPAKPEKKERKSRKPAVTRSTADARLWAARTLAENGADVAEIARQTGLSREAAILLVRRAQLT